MSKEIADLCNDPPEGIKIFPNEEDITDIQAQIEGPCESFDILKYWIMAICLELTLLFDLMTCISSIFVDRTGWEDAAYGSDESSTYKVKIIKLGTHVPNDERKKHHFKSKVKLIWHWVIFYGHKLRPGTHSAISLSVST